MTLQEEKQLLKTELDSINDLQVIIAIRQILQYAKFNREEEAIKPFNHAEVLKQNPVFKSSSYEEAAAVSKKSGIDKSEK
jgi:hypothetical protein